MPTEWEGQCTSVCAVFADRNTIIACALTNTRFHICVTFHPLQCELIDLHLGHTLTVCCVTHLQCWSQTIMIIGHSLRQNLAFSLIIWTPNEIVDTTTPKHKITQFFFCFSVSNSPIFLTVFFLLYTPVLWTRMPAVIAPGTSPLTEWFLPSGVWCRVHWYLGTIILEERTTSITLIFFYILLGLTLRNSTSNPHSTCFLQKRLFRHRA